MQIDTECEQCGFLPQSNVGVFDCFRWNLDVEADVHPLDFHQPMGDLPGRTCYERNLTMSTEHESMMGILNYMS